LLITLAIIIVSDQLTSAEKDCMSMVTATLFAMHSDTITKIQYYYSIYADSNHRTQDCTT